MFRIYAPITKSKKDEQRNVLLIEWFASDPSIDKDYERFTEDAIQKMASSVNDGNIPIRVEHEKKFYSDIWVWKSATMIDNRLFLTWEIDLDLSLWRDLEVLLSKGKQIGLSVWGNVISAVKEYAKELWRNITAYTDVILKEVSVVLNPSHNNTTLSIAKSFSEKETASETELEKADFPEGYAMIAVEKWCGTKKEKKEYKKAFDKIDMLFLQKDSDECEPMESEKEGITTEDMILIAQITKILSELDVDNVQEPEQLKDWEYSSSLPKECYVYEVGDRAMPHHDENYNVVLDWVKYWLAAIISGKAYSYLTPKDFTNAIKHLYYHYKVEMSKTQKSMKGASLMNVNLWENEVALIKSAYAYKQLGQGQRPQVDGNDLSDKEITKLADAYVTLWFRKSVSIADAIRTDFAKSSEDNNSGAVEEVAKTEDTEETPAEVTEEVTKTEEVTEGTTQVVEEQGEVVETTTSEEPKEEEVAKTEESDGTNADEEVAKTEETTEETEAPAEAVAEETTEVAKEETTDEEAPVEKGQEFITREEFDKAISAMNEALAAKDAKIEALEKSQNEMLEKQSEVTKSHMSVESEFAKATNEKLNGIVNTVDAVSKRVEEIANAPSFRKSFGIYTTVAKNTSSDSSEKQLTPEEAFTKAVTAKMDAGLSLANARAEVLKEMTSQG